VSRSNAQSTNAPLGDPSVVDVVVVTGVVVVVGAVVVVGPTTHVASQQLPEPATPPRASHFSAVDLIEQWFTTGGHAESSAQAVTPSSQTPFVHVPAPQIAQVTKPSFFPQLERAAQRVTAPLQFTSTSPLRTASRT
jgi:hypothetical protein